MARTSVPITALHFSVRHCASPNVARGSGSGGDGDGGSGSGGEHSVGRHKCEIVPFRSAHGGVLGGLGYSTRASPNGEIASVYGVYTPVPPSGARFQVMTEAVIGTCTHRMLGGSCWRWAGGLKVEQKHKGYICSSDAIALTEAGEQLHAEGTCTSL